MKIPKIIVYAVVLLAVLFIAEASFAFKCNGILHDQFGNLIANKTIRIALRKDDAAFVTKTDSNGFFSIEKKDKLRLWWFYYKMDTDSGYGYLFDGSNPDLVDYVLRNEYTVDDVNKLVNVTGEKLDSIVLKMLASDKTINNYDSLFFELFKINDHIKLSVLKAIYNKYSRRNAVDYLLYLGDLDLLKTVLDESRYWTPEEHLEYSTLIMPLINPIPNEFKRIILKGRKQLGWIIEQSLFALALNYDASSLSLIKSIDKKATKIINFKETYLSSIPFSDDITKSIQIAFQLIQVETSPYDHGVVNTQKIESITYDRNKVKALVAVHVGDFSACEYAMVLHLIDGRWVLKNLRPTRIYN